MANALCFACLGRPLLLSKGQDPVAVKTRKALAIMGYLSRKSGLASPREALADLLWSGTDRHKAMQSLRQALRQLKTAEEAAGMDVVRSSPGHVQLDSAVFSSDLTRVLELVERGRTGDFHEAEELWRGDFLSGFEDIDPEFSEWLLVERERVHSEVTGAAFRHLNQVTVDDGGVQVEAGGRFLLKIDPACEAAHRVLIRLYKKLGQKERAEQQYQACVREMRLHLDVEPEPETKALLEEDTATVRETVTQAVEDPGSALLNSESVIRLPEISILAATETNPSLAEAQNLKEEIVAGLSSFRSFDLYHGDYFGEDNLPSPTLVKGHELGSYLLRFRHNERGGKVAIQFEDRTDGRIVFNEIVDLNQWENLQAAASQTISRIHLFTMGKLRNPGNSAAFARWCQAEALMWDFDPQSDRKALQLLNDLERRHSNFSMVFSAKALINMKQLIHYPIEDREIGLAMDDILALSEHAVLLDPWQPLNQRAYGWALIQSKMSDQARRAFLQAGRLNTVDPANLMSVAEGLAFAGDIALAKKNAETAMALFTSVPRVFYEYYSNVFFAAEDYETAAQFIERASYTSMSGLTTRIAALLCAGKRDEAVQVLERLSDKYSEILKNTLTAQENPNEWAKNVNLFQDPKTRLNYEQGVNLVKKFFFGDRATI
ncbi:BTAD domain-containing putative transcriptional regulator [Roseibium sp. Sym1]|uniref:BTAD domain-containing putative transcriptional regulator n=1 Tax=Roseibium sp. Sym1 TaxID=3016006 RepID=UPI0022B42B1D|nr:BTAD domain-containing putative transcriptional regulator [Roseibium sp. Sym1]